jgi:hypothetical protein
MERVKLAVVLDPLQVAEENVVTSQLRIHQMNLVAPFNQTFSKVDDMASDPGGRGFDKFEKFHTVSTQKSRLDDLRCPFPRKVAASPKASTAEVRRPLFIRQRANSTRNSVNVHCVDDNR